MCPQHSHNASHISYPQFFFFICQCYHIFMLLSKQQKHTYIYIYIFYIYRKIHLILQLLVGGCCRGIVLKFVTYCRFFYEMRLFQTLYVLFLFYLVSSIAFAIVIATTAGTSFFSLKNYSTLKLYQSSCALYAMATH